MTTFAMTSPVRVNVRRASGTAPVGADLEADLRLARWIANWLDAKFSIGGIRFGLDAIVGLVPVVGDALGALAGVFPIWVAKRHGLGKAVQARMAMNLLTEWGLGSVPLIGDAFDVAFKANLRNIKLLEEAVAKRSIQ